MAKISLKMINVILDMEVNFVIYEKQDWNDFSVLRSRQNLILQFELGNQEKGLAKMCERFWLFNN